MLPHESRNVRLTRPSVIFGPPDDLGGRHFLQKLEKGCRAPAAASVARRQAFITSVKSDFVHNSSTHTARPSPPPIQMPARPRLPPRSRSALSNVTMMRAPLAPIGCPREIA